MTILGASTRRRFLAALPALAAPAAFAQGSPLTTVICPFSAGGTADVQLRALCAAAARELGGSVVVENRPGAGGTTGPAALVGKPADGRLLSMATGIALLRQPFMRPTRYDPAKDFTYIHGITRFECGLVVRADAPWKTFDEFVKDAKRKPGSISYGTAGVATAQHGAMLELADKLGIEWTHVPYKGSGEVFNALAGGHVQAISETSGWASFVDAGKFRLLAVYGEKRLQRWPQTPTLKELGHDVNGSIPWGIVGPAGMDAKLVERLSAVFHQALSDADLGKLLVQLGQEPWDAGPQAYRETTIARIPLEKRLVERYNLKEQ